MSSSTVKNIDVEGLTLPNIALTNIQLIEAAKKLNIKNFRGVFYARRATEKTKTERVRYLESR